MGLSPTQQQQPQAISRRRPAQIVRGEKTLAPLRPRKRSDGTSSPNARANDMGQILTSQPHELLIWGPYKLGACSTEPAARPCGRRFFYFFIFYFRFLQKYIFDLEIYRNIPRPPRCRTAGTWPPGSGAAGAFLEKISQRKLHVGP